MCRILFVCLWFIVPSRIFHSYGDVTITGSGLQILTYARHSRPLSSEGSLACHTYCDTTGHLYYNGHLRGPVTHTCCRAFSNGTVTTRFFDLGRSWDSNTQPSACRANVLTHCATAAVRMCRWIKLYLHTCICTSFQQTLIINSVSQNKYSKRLNLLLHNPNTSGIHETFSKIEFI